MSDESRDTAAAPQPRVFHLRKVYLKDCSFEAPDAPARFPARTDQPWNPDTKLQLAHQHRRIDDRLIEVTLAVTVTVESGEKTVFLSETHQAGLFDVSGFSDDELGHLAGTKCLDILFPFAREVIAGLVMRGGFPQLLLAPINFDVLYAQRLRQLAEAEQQKGGSAATH